MKKFKLIPTMLMISVLVLSLVFCAAPAEAANSDLAPVFLLAFSSSDSSTVEGVSACYVADQNGNTYLVTISPVTNLLDQGYTATLCGKDFQESAEYVSSYGDFAFFSVPELSDVEPIPVGSDITSTGYVDMIGSNYEVTSNAVTLDDSWSQEDGYLKSSSLDSPGTEVWGSPVKNSNSEAIGLVAGDGTNCCIILFSAAEFPEEAIIASNGSNSGIGSGSGSSGSGSSGSGSSKKNKKSSSDDEDGFPSWIIWTCLGLGVAAAIGVASKKKSGGNGGQTDAVDSVSVGEGTIPLDFDMDGPTVSDATPMAFDAPPLMPDATPGMPGAIVMTPPIAPLSQWQIRAMGGNMDGRLFLLTSTLKLGRQPNCDVVFDQRTPGISGEHCMLMVDNDQVILQDMNSTFGTFLAKKTRLEPRVNYHLQEGDTFTLAEGGQTFRLERAGADLRDTGPAVKGIAGDRVYQADIHGRLSFGRDPRNQVAFDARENGISANHCVLYRENGKLFLMDSGSTNGTFFDGGQRLRPNVPYPVRKGQCFYLTSHKNTFVITED